MSDEKQRFIMYMCFETDQKDETCRSLAVRSSMPEIEKWKKENRCIDSTDAKSAPDAGEIELDGSEERNDDSPQEPSDELSQLMSRFQETMSSYRPLWGLA